MRILHMIPDISVSNGILSVILNYAKAMPEDIVFDVVYFAEKPQTRQADIEALGGRVYKIDAPSPKSAVKRDMEKFFKQHSGEWSTLHIHAPHFAVFIAPFAKKAGIKKICRHCHSTTFSLDEANIKRNAMLTKLGAPFCTQSFACSKAAGKYWYGSGFTVLNNAIDCSSYAFDEEKRSKTRAAFGLCDGDFAVGHIGRTDVVQKNHPFILEVFSEIKKKNQSARLFLIGAEPTEETTALCQKYDITDSVEFLGMRSDVPSLLQGFDAFLFPSTSEGLPVSVIEAQAAGLPVIMSEAVTEEAVEVPEVMRLSLSLSAEEWAQAVIDGAKNHRKNNFELMKAAGWDIFSAAQTLADYYRG